MNLIIQEYENKNIIVDSWVQGVSEEELLERIKDMFFEDVYKDEFDELIQGCIEHLSTDERTFMFYKLNLIEFTKRHDFIINKLRDIFESVRNLPYANSVDEIPDDFYSKFSDIKDDEKKVKEYNKFVNKEFFMDPNSPPDTVKNILKELDGYYQKYIYVPIIAVDKIHRLKYFIRKTVTVVDTDSNILALDHWVNFCKKYVLTSDYGRSEENNEFIMINTMTYFMTTGVASILNEYGLHSYIPDDWRPRFNMKNEFYFNRLIIGKKKKRYLSLQKLREGNLLVHGKPDIKGFDFRKATTSEEMKNLFEGIVNKRIFGPKVPDVVGIINDLREIENMIMTSIKNGETRYLPLGNAKELSAYKDPFSQQAIRGMIAWNYIYPDNQIDIPSKVSLLKLNFFDENDIEGLKDTYPREHWIIKDKIFHNSNEKISSKGLQVLAIPSNANIPEWCKPYIDYNTVVNNILGQFRGVLDVFGVNCPEVGKQVKSVNRKTKRFSNIVRF